jgi:hypothetical protein
LLGIYEFPVDHDERAARDYPKVFEVASVRGFGRRDRLVSEGAQWRA